MSLLYSNRRSPPFGGSLSHITQAIDRSYRTKVNIINIIAIMVRDEIISSIYIKTTSLKQTDNCFTIVLITNRNKDCPLWIGNCITSIPQ